MMTRILSVLLLLATFQVNAQRNRLSDNARVFVITCGPGQNELYSAFGHSAFWIYDSTRRVDMIYNYGIFNFHQPHFYLNFTKGNLLYQLGTDNYEEFAYPYMYFNRYLHGQELNLSLTQKQKLFDYLNWNARPENEVYRYDYFYNNCATKIRDVMVAALGNDVTFDMSYVKTDYTIRQLTDLYIEEKQPWGDLGIDICLGLPMDKKAAPLEYMFLPEYVESGFDHALIKMDSQSMPLVKRKFNFFEPSDVAINKGLPHPLYVMLGVFAVGLLISLWDLKRQKTSAWFDALILTVTGLLGLLLSVLWFFTDHAAAAKNFNLLWAVPFNVVAAIAMIKNPKWLKTYFLVIGILSVVTLLAWKILPQDLHYALIPIVMLIAVRSFLQYWIRMKKNRLKA